jgi:hypothetical protein
VRKFIVWNAPTPAAPRSALVVIKLEIPVPNSPCNDVRVVRNVPEGISPSHRIPKAESLSCLIPRSTFYVAALRPRRSTTRSRRAARATGSTVPSRS